MGVDRTDYIMYGWKLPYKIKDRNDEVIDLWGDKLLPYVEGHKGVDERLIVDGMCGEYCVFGTTIKTGGDQYSGWTFEELNINGLDSTELRKKYSEIFNNEIEEEPKLFLFSHYS